MRPTPHSSIWMRTLSRRQTFQRYSRHRHGPVPTSTATLRGVRSARNYNCTSSYSTTATVGTSYSSSSVLATPTDTPGPSAIRTYGHSPDTNNKAGPSSEVDRTPPPHPPRLRFAPSPTGYLHLGGLRTALLNHIVAKQGKGKWVLRIEDTDRERFVEGAVDSMRRSLEWAGLEYDEGPGAGGSYGPYYQSERLDLYHQYIKQLLDDGHAYECFCSQQDLEADRAKWKNSAIQLNYDGRCRHLTDEDRARRRRAGERFVVRFKDPGRLPSMPRDIVFGKTKAHTDIGTPDAFIKDDFIILKRDGFPTYHFANVVDDHVMDITHVLRGEEWLASLPKHVNLYKAFGWKMPVFAHLPLLVHSDGTKLSKRHGDTSVDSYMAAGYEPEALVNFLALLGWDYSRSLEDILQSQPYTPDSRGAPSLDDGSENPQAPAETLYNLPPSTRRDTHSLHEVFTLSQLIETFNLDHLTRRKATVNADKLEFLNKMHLRSRAGMLGNDGLMVGLGKSVAKKDVEGWRRMIERFQSDLRMDQEIGNHPLIDNWEFIAEIFELEMPRVRKFKELSEGIRYWFQDPSYDTKEARAVVQKFSQEQYLRTLSLVIPRLEKIASEVNHFDRDDGWVVANRVMLKLGLKHRGSIMLVMRHAITGQKRGPAVPDIMAVLGPEIILARMKAALAFVERQGTLPLRDWSMVPPEEVDVEGLERIRGDV